MGELDGKKAVVVGASRGLGRGIAEALSRSGASVLAIAREDRGLVELTAACPSIQTAVADAADPTLAGTVLDAQDPDILAVVAGASPLLHPIHHHSWETFSLNWHVDVRLTFNWLREALLRPLRPGSRVLLMSSGAATHGSPMSGGYAGAKATIRFMAASADDEAQRGPGNPGGRRAATAHPGHRAGARDGPQLRGARRGQRGAVRQDARSAGHSGNAGQALVTLASGELGSAVAYSLTGDDGLTPLPALA